MDKDSKWYLVQCKPRESFRAEIQLSNQGYQCFHPTYPLKKTSRDSIQTLLSPLFPYYLFVSLNQLTSWSSIRSTRGVSRMVTFNGVPASISNDLIEDLRNICIKMNHSGPENMFKKGDRVRITQGCFKDLEAIVMAPTGEERVILLLNLFNRQQHLELPETSLAMSG
ncbi:MAG: transcription/translation regulatory transformer protein RfaH [Legionellaceae bacterium]|nr:transcription/translation regulatory transformer protein RfaH [Legionellaceae bacterium]